MGIQHWKDLRHKMGKARRKQLRREVEQQILDMDPGKRKVRDKLDAAPPR